MKTKNKIGVLVILGGIAVIGIYWFKKNKPNIAKEQLKKLQELSNYYSRGEGASEETMITGIGSRPLLKQDTAGAFVKWTFKEQEEFNKAMAELEAYSGANIVTNQIADNMKNLDFGNDFAGLKFDNIKLPYGY